MKLYHSPQSRSVRPRWLLEEIGEPYEVVKLDLQSGETKRPEYLKIHPHGAVPALQDGDLVLFESAAICAYLADKYPEKKLAPELGTAERGLYYQWMIYSIATLEPPIVQLFMNTVMLPEEQRSEKAAHEARESFKKIGEVLEKALEGRESIVGKSFGAADIMIGSTLAWAGFMGVLADFPGLQQYVNHLAERPAFQRAQAD